MTVQSKSPEQIEHEIRTTRREIDRTLDAIQTRLSPGQLLDQALGYVRAGGGEFAANFGRTVTQNPIPATLLGVGCLWLMCSRTRADERRPAAGYAGNGDARPAQDRDWPGFLEAGEAAEEIGAVARDSATAAAGTVMGYAEAAGDAARSYAQSAEETVQKYTDKAKQYADTARQQSARVTETTKHVVQDYPLAVGAIGLAIGALAAALLPATQRENELVGKAADEFKQATRTALGEQAEKIGKVAGSAADAAAEAASQQAGEQGLTSAQEDKALS